MKKVKMDGWISTILFFYEKIPKRRISSLQNTTTFYFYIFLKFEIFKPGNMT